MPSILAVSVLSLATVYVAQYGFDLEPCILCLYQRVPFAVAGGLALLGMIWRGRLLTIASLAGVAFLVGSGIAFYHTGVEQHWWASATGCSGNLPQGFNADQFLAKLQQKQPKACDDIDWTLFGISMATYNVFYSFGLAAITFAAVAWIRGRTKGQTEQS